MAQISYSSAIEQIIDSYIDVLKTKGIKIWRLYLYGSYAKGVFTENSDIDLAVFIDADEIDGFEEDALLMKLRRMVDLKIEPHAFARTDFDLSNPLVNEIVKTGHRII